MTSRFLAPAVMLALTAACAQAPASAPTGQISAARGEYIVSTSGCHDCHTPFILGPNGPEPDMTRMLSGHPATLTMGPVPAVDPSTGWVWGGGETNTAFYGPWGVTYAANLTPDENTGLGIWTEDMFMRAIREGKHMGTSRPILPPMPWPVYRNWTDDDMKSVFAYLRTIPTASNRVPEPVVADPPAGG